MNIIVIGGAGFIGSFFSTQLLQQGHHVTIFDNFTSGTQDHISSIISHDKLNLVESDLKDLDAITNAMRGQDLVIHTAANPDIAKAITEPTIDFWEGTYLTNNLLEAMRTTGTKKIVYTSGSGVYGEYEGVPFLEDHGPNIPISTYGASKLGCEALIQSYVHMFGFTALIFRFANVVGPKQTHGVGYDFLRKLKSDPTKLEVLGDGSQDKSYIHVSDIFDAFVVASRHMAEERLQIYNVASNDTITVKDIALLAIETMGIDRNAVDIQFGPGPRGWAGDVPVIDLNCTRLKKIGWSSEISSRRAILMSLQSMCEELQNSQ